MEKLDEKDRCSGRTTRLIDGLIQELFKEGKIKVYDHWDAIQSHEMVFKKILKRLSVEHPKIGLNADINLRIIEIMK